MNKFLMFPYAIIIMIAIITIAMSNDYGAGMFTGNHTVETSGNITIDENVTTVNLPESGEMNIQFTELEGALVILTIAIAIAIVAGIHVLGSGLSDTSQRLIFYSAIYLGIWAVFSILASPLLFAIASFGILIWIILTLMVVIGFAGEVSGSEA